MKFCLISVKNGIAIISDPVSCIDIAAFFADGDIERKMAVAEDVVIKILLAVCLLTEADIFLLVLSPERISFYPAVFKPGVGRPFAG